MNDDAVVVQPAASAENPFSYLERDEFSAEKFKIEVKNLPKYYGINVNTKH